MLAGGVSGCSSFQYPALKSKNFDTAGLAKLLQDGFGLNANANGHPSFLDSPDTQAALYCAADVLECYGICPNADLAGVGVRIAFWLSSILQAWLVAVSPEDSTQGAWTAVILTASVTIPAFAQKRQKLLSLYHATLVLNFATFSSIVSLAIAPMCTVWREGDSGDEYTFPTSTMDVTHAGIYVGTADETEEHMELEGPPSPGPWDVPQQKVHRKRLLLSLALLMQVALQWSWAIMLFTDPVYAQTACSPTTIVLLFGFPFQSQTINDHLYFLWPLWLLFSIGTTLVWGVLLVKNSSPSVHPILSRQTSRDIIPRSWQIPVDKGRLMVLLGNATAFLVALLFLVSSEVQAGINCVRGGENTTWSFGQIAAFLVALAPAWSICSAVTRPTRKLRCTNAGHLAVASSDISVSVECETPRRSEDGWVGYRARDAHDSSFLSVNYESVRHRTPSRHGTSSSDSEDQSLLVRSESPV